jgi:hypothetical protein
MLIVHLSLPRERKKYIDINLLIMGLEWKLAEHSELQGR